MESVAAPRREVEKRSGRYGGGGGEEGEKGKKAEKLAQSLSGAPNPPPQQFPAIGYSCI